MKYRKLFSMVMASVLFVTGMQQGAMPLVSAETEPAGTALFDAEPLATSDNSFGAMLAADINGQQAQIRSGCVIYNAEMCGDAALVRFDTVQDSRIIVGLYEDPGDDEKKAPKLLGTGICDVTAEQKEVFINIAGLDSVPDYYLIRAYLVGTNGMPLSPEYENPMHTWEMSNLLNSDIYSYAGYEVLNLDEDTTTNFAVYNKDVTVLKSSSTENVVTDQNPEAGVYSISNYSGPTKTGSFVAIEGSDNNVAIFKIGSVSKSGAVTTIQANTNVDTNDAFAYIKIETDTSQSTCEYTPPDQSELPEGITVSGGIVTDGTSQRRPAIQSQDEATDEDTDSNDVIEKQFRFQIGGSDSSDGPKHSEFEVEVNAGIDMTFSGYFRIYHSGVFKLIDIGLDLSAALTAEISGGVSCRIPFGGVDSKLLKKLLSLRIGPYFFAELSGKLTLSLPTARISYYSDEGWSHSFSSCNAELSAEGSIGIGAGMGAELFNSAEAQIDITIGLHGEIAPSEPHDGCGICKEGTLDVEVRGCAKIGLNNEKLKWISDALDIGIEKKVDFQIFEFYISDTLGFGRGECPNKHPKSQEIPDGGSDEDDGLTQEQREMFSFYEITIDGKEGYEVGLNPAKFESKGNPNAVPISSITVLDFPDTYKGKPVLAISAGTFGPFHHLNDLQSMKLPQYLMYIPSHAFTNCVIPQQLKIPDTVESIGPYAFSGTAINELILPNTTAAINKYDWTAFRESIISSITIPEGVTALNSTYLFTNQMHLKKVNFPSTLTEIGEKVFYNCPLLQIELPPSLKTIGLSAFAIQDSYRSLAYLQDAPQYTLTIPSSVERILAGAFEYRTNINKIIFSNPKTPINPNSAPYVSGKFRGMPNLTTVVLERGWTFIPIYMFLEMESLTAIELPLGLLEIGNGAFVNKKKLQSITIPETVKSIGGNVFSGCESLTSVTIPASVEKMYFSSFSRMPALKSIKFLNPNIEFLDSPQTIHKDYLDSYSGLPFWYYDQLTIYGYSDSTAQAFAENPDHKCRFVALDFASGTPAVTTSPAASSAGTSTVTEPEKPKDEPKSITFNGLKPNTLYNFYDLLGDDFVAENLLYLSQGVSDENGTLTVWYRPAKDDSNANKFVRCYEPEPTVTRRGDMNLDGKVDVSDAVQLMRFIVEDRTLVVTKQGLANADANANGTVDSDDCSTILKYIAKIIKEL